MNDNKGMQKDVFFLSIFYISRNFHRPKWGKISDAICNKSWSGSIPHPHCFPKTNMHSAFSSSFVSGWSPSEFRSSLPFHLPCRITEPLLRRLPCVDNGRLVLRMLPPLICRVLLTFTHNYFFFSAVICLLLRSFLLLLLMWGKVNYSNMILSYRIYDIWIPCIWIASILD
jgi:hypothetical protein